MQSIRTYWRRPAGAALLLGLVAGPARAQQAPPPNMALLGNDPALTAYPGPRYPGGPDSLRATVRRGLRAASPALVGQLFLHLELDSTGRARAAYFLAPPAGAPSSALFTSPEAQRLAQQLMQQLLPWQVPRLVPSPLPSPASSVTLPLDFGPQPQPVARAYGDELPTFSVVPIAVPGRSRGVVPRSLVEFVGRQVRYPADDLRRGRQGTVFAYFEVSETGRVEQRRIIGSVSPALDAGVLRVLLLLPSALTPPRYQGQPARVFYVLPMSFRIP